MSRILLTLKTLEKASNDVELNFIQKQSSVLGHCNTTTATAVSPEVTVPHENGINGISDAGLEGANNDFGDSGFDQSQLFLNLTDLDDPEVSNNRVDQSETSSMADCRTLSSNCYAFRSLPKAIAPTTSPLLNAIASPTSPLPRISPPFKASASPVPMPRRLNKLNFDQLRKTSSSDQKT